MSGPVPRRVWFRRTFDLGLPPEAFPDIVERLRGTPARLEERLGSVAREGLVAKPDGSWSLQETAGHLVDVEALWTVRLEELVRGQETLTAADLQNRKTEAARHNDRPLRDILESFRRVRGVKEACPTSPNLRPGRRIVPG